MPKTQQEIVRLTRDVESGQQVYMQLLNKQQELKITEASTVGDVRIVDPAIAQPGVLKPKTALIILGSIILGLMLSVVGVLLRSLFNRGIESPVRWKSMVSACMPVFRCLNGKKRVITFRPLKV